jgi:hypothetical protein
MTINGDSNYTEFICQKFVLHLGWSRKRRKKWLRRQGLRLTRQPDLPDELVLDDGPDRCWCGVENPYFADVHGTCGGTGMLDCFCGGDQCVCHNHGEVECFGCEDCESDFGGDGDDDYYSLEDL